MPPFPICGSCESEARSPEGLDGQAAVLSPAQVKQVFRISKSRQRHADRAEALFALSIGLGLRAKEQASLRWSDVYEPDGKVRQVVPLKAAYTKGAKVRDVFVSSPPLRKILPNYREKRGPWSGGVPDGPLFRSRKGRHMTASSMARFLTGLYREAGIQNASSHSGRRTLITGLAERGIDLKAIAEIAGHSSIPDDGRLRRDQSDAPRPHPAGRVVVSAFVRISTALSSPHGGQAPDHDLWIESDRLGERQEFDEINPSLAALHPGDERLVLTQTTSQLGLGEAGVLPKLDEHPHQRPVPRRI